MNNKKQRELRFLERLRQADAAFPRGALECSEEPDALLRTPTHVLGFEVTELHQRDDADRSQRAQEAERESVLAVARQIAESSSISPVFVQVHFKPRMRLLKRQRQVLGEALMGLVAENLPGTGQVATLTGRQIGTPLSPFVRRIRILAQTGRHRWVVPGGGWVLEDFVDELQQRIDAKNARYDGYRAKCDACWLVVVAAGTHPSSWFEASAATVAQYYSSRFDRTVFMEGDPLRFFELRKRLSNTRCTRRPLVRC